MLDHISLAVTDLERSIRLYDAILEPLGYRRLWTYTDGAGYGIRGQDDAFAIRRHAATALAVSKQTHIAFRRFERRQGRRILRGGDFAWRSSGRRA